MRKIVGFEVYLNEVVTMTQMLVAFLKGLVRSLSKESDK